MQDILNARIAEMRDRYSAGVCLPALPHTPTSRNTNGLTEKENIYQGECLTSVDNQAFFSEKGK